MTKIKVTKKKLNKGMTKTKVIQKKIEGRRDKNQDC